MTSICNIVIGWGDDAICKATQSKECGGVIFPHKETFGGNHDFMLTSF
jgi:hypothetical protein